MKRSNCVVWALRQKLRHGGRIRVRRSPDYPLLPRAAWSDDGRTWYRFTHARPLRNPAGLRKWLPLHALWFRGQPRKDTT